MKGLRDYLIKTLNGMALGLFSSLIIGLILKQIGVAINWEPLIKFGTVAQSLMGPAIVSCYGVKSALTRSSIGTLACAAVGAVGASNCGRRGRHYHRRAFWAHLWCTLWGADASKLTLQEKTKVDIILVPGHGNHTFADWLGSL